MVPKWVWGPTRRGPKKGGDLVNPRQSLGAVADQNGRDLPEHDHI
jgi:hypothetical protein